MFFWSLYIEIGSIVINFLVILDPDKHDTYWSGSTTLVPDIGRQGLKKFGNRHFQYKITLHQLFLSNYIFLSLFLFSFSLSLFLFLSRSLSLSFSLIVCLSLVNNLFYFGISDPSLDWPDLDPTLKIKRGLTDNITGLNFSSQNLMI